MTSGCCSWIWNVVFTIKMATFELQERPQVMASEYIVGVDIGGTFTDRVVADERGTLTIGKTPYTPPDFSAATMAAI